MSLTSQLYTKYLLKTSLLQSGQKIGWDMTRFLFTIRSGNQSLGPTLLT